MTALFLYGAVLLMVASVMVNRFGQSRAARVTKKLNTDESALRSLDQKLVEIARSMQANRLETANLEDQITDARLAVDNMNDRLDKAKAAPMERYYIFDRLDTRPGTIWSLQISRPGDMTLSDARLASAWQTPRTYLIVAGNQREAMDRAGQRFPRNNGFEIGLAVPCHLFRSRRQGRDDSDLAMDGAQGMRPPSRNPERAAG